jgi:hypothetical protein
VFSLSHDLLSDKLDIAEDLRGATVKKCPRWRQLPAAAISLEDGVPNSWSSALIERLIAGPATSKAS